MIPLSALSAPSDLVAFIALGGLAAIYGLMPAHLVLASWTRKRWEIALLLALAGARRGATYLHFDEVAVALLIASAMAASLAAFTAARSVLREVRRASAS